MDGYASYRRPSGRPFYRNPALLAWTVIFALALLLVLYLVEMG